MEGQRLPELERAVWEVHVDDTVRDYIVRLVGATRTHPDLALGASPRGSLALFKAAQALAALRGRDYVLPDDVKELALPALAHRLVVRPESVLRGTPRRASWATFCAARRWILAACRPGGGSLHPGAAYQGQVGRTGPPGKCAWQLGRGVPK